MSARMSASSLSGTAGASDLFARSGRSEARFFLLTRPSPCTPPWGNAPPRQRVSARGYHARGRPETSTAIAWSWLVERADGVARKDAAHLSRRAVEEHHRLAAEPADEQRLDAPGLGVVEHGPE